MIYYEITKQHSKYEMKGEPGWSEMESYGWNPQMVLFGDFVCLWHKKKIKNFIKRRNEEGTKKKLSHLFAFLALKIRWTPNSAKIIFESFSIFLHIHFFCYIDISWVPTWDEMMLCIWQFELELSAWSINFVKYYLNSVCLSYFF